MITPITAFFITDYANPILACSSSTIRYISTASGEDYNVSDTVSVSPTREDVTVTYTPSETIRVDYTTIGVLQKINVCAVDKWGAEDRCSFIVETKGKDYY